MWHSEQRDTSLPRAAPGGGEPRREQVWRRAPGPGPLHHLPLPGSRASANRPRLGVPTCRVETTISEGSCEGGQHPDKPEQGPGSERACTKCQPLSLFSFLNFSLSVNIPFNRFCYKYTEPKHIAYVHTHAWDTGRGDRKSLLAQSPSDPALVHPLGGGASSASSQRLPWTIRCALICLILAVSPRPSTGQCSLTGH